MGFRTSIIISTTSLLLGSTFTHWIVDHNTLWRSPVTSSALHTSLSYYSAYVSAPPVVFGVWLSTVILAVVSLAWKCVKGWKEGKGAFLFDAAGLFLFLAVAWIHLTDINPNYKLIPQSIPSPLPPTFLADKPVLVKVLRDLAASHAISAVALTGVMAMQAARYYSAHLDSSDSPDESLLSPISPSVQAAIADDTPETADVPSSPLNEKFATQSEGVSTGLEAPESPTRRRSSREREARASKRKTGSGTGK